MVSRSSDTAAQRPRPRLYLVTPLIVETAAFARTLAAVLPVADVAAVLLRLADAAERDLINRAKPIVQVTQLRNVALLLDGRAEIAARAGADGAHLTGVAALREAITILQPTRIAGAGGLLTRHDAMLAGEAGADYVMFGEPDAQGRRPSQAAVVDRVAWWAEVFQPPCVAFADAPDQVAPFAEAGADFVALGDWIWAAAAGPAAVVAAAARELGAEEPACA
jgi:thiamine-phosphate pyrophosphorylase